MAAWMGKGQRAAVQDEGQRAGQRIENERRPGTAAGRQSFDRARGQGAEGRTQRPDKAVTSE